MILFSCKIESRTRDHDAGDQRIVEMVDADIRNNGCGKLCGDLAVLFDECAGLGWPVNVIVIE